MNVNREVARSVLCDLAFTALNIKKQLVFNQNKDQKLIDLCDNIFKKMSGENNEFSKYKSPKIEKIKKDYGFILKSLFLLSTLEEKTDFLKSHYTEISDFITENDE